MFKMCASLLKINELTERSYKIISIFNNNNMLHGGYDGENSRK